MSNDIELPKESKPESKEIVRVQDTKLLYIPQNEVTTPTETNHARALATRDLSSPGTRESILTMSKLDRRAILTGNFLLAFQKRINQLRGIPNGLQKMLYPEMSFFSDVKYAIDLQSVGDGTARMELTAVLSTPEFQQFGFGGGNFENLRRNYQHELPEHLDPPKEKKWLGLRNK